MENSNYNKMNLSLSRGSRNRNKNAKDVKVSSIFLGVLLITGALAMYVCFLSMTISRDLPATDDSLDFIPGDSHILSDLSTIGAAHPPSPSVLYRPLIARQNSHHIYLDIGSPSPRRKLLIVDTGSYMTAFPCQGCRNCGKKHTDSIYFHHEESSTGSLVECDSCNDGSYCVPNVNRKKVCWISMKYMEGSSWTGYEVSDVVSFGWEDYHDNYFPQYSSSTNEESSAKHVFGCINSETGTFRSQAADGIMGLADKAQSISIVHSFYTSGKIPENTFSLCLSKTGGIFSLGGSANAAHLDRQMSYSPLDPNVTLYKVKIKQVMIGSIQVEGNLGEYTRKHNAIIDSGSTDTFLPLSIAIPFKKTWKEVTGLDFTNEPAIFDPEEFLKLPTIVVVLEGGYHWKLYPQNYFEFNGSNSWTNRIYLDEPSGAVLGANAMFGHDIKFDIINKRLGIVEADCNKNLW